MVLAQELALATSVDNLFQQYVHANISLYNDHNQYSIFQQYIDVISLFQQISLYNDCYQFVDENSLTVLSIIGCM